MNPNTQMGFSGGQQPGYPPPQGAGYPSQGSPYPPQGSPYPPQGSPYPPQGSPYPPQGSPYPPIQPQVQAGFPHNQGYPAQQSGYTPGYHSGYLPQGGPGYSPAVAQGGSGYPQPHNPGTLMGPPAAAAAIAAGSAVHPKSVAGVVSSTLGQSSSAYPGIEGSYAKTQAEMKAAKKAAKKGLPIGSVTGAVAPNLYGPGGKHGKMKKKPGGGSSSSSCDSD